MSESIHFSACPVCGSENLQNLFSVKDHTVSGESFGIIHCHDCSFRFTEDIPAAEVIGKYYQSDDYVSHTDTAKGLINNLYHRVRKRTLRQKRKLLQSSTGLEKGSLLDVGSGTGAFLNEMKEQGWQTKGLEPDAGAREMAKKRYSIGLQEMDILFQLPQESFDAITLWHVLEHVHDLHGYIAQLRLLLKEKGKIFIAVPNYTSRDATVYKEHWAAWDVPRHLWHFSPKAIQVLMNKHGLKIEQYKPMWFDSFYVSMLSSKYKHGKTNLVGSFWQGFLSNLKAWGNVQRCSSVIYIISK